MEQQPTEAFWSLLCSFRHVVILGWSVCLVFFGITLALLVTNTTNQRPILILNLIILTPPVVISAAILVKCRNRL